MNNVFISVVLVLALTATAVLKLQVLVGLWLATTMVSLFALPGVSTVLYVVANRKHKGV